MLKGSYRLLAPILLLVLQVTQASTPEQALQAYQKGDYALAYSRLAILAEQGHADAQYHLGTLYQEGKGVQQDYKQAAHWYQAASSQGHAKAQFSLGNAYKHGHGLEQDDREALSWWKRSAQQSHTRAQYHYGIALLFGRGTQTDEQRALEWLGKAADSGYAPAQSVMSQINGKNSQELVTAIRNYHSLPASTDWVRDRPAKHFTIQMMAGPSERDIKRFWQSNKIDYPAAIYRFKYGQDDWHGLIIGDFDSPAQARRALSTMSTTLQAKRPWIRRFDSVQKTLVGTDKQD